MNKRLLLLAIALTLPVAGVVLWMIASSPSSTTALDTVPEAPAVALDATIPSGASVPVMVTDRPLADPSKIVRFSDKDFPELLQDVPVPAPAPSPVAISPRFTVPAEAKAAALVQGLRNTPAVPNERIRVLPADSAEPSAQGGSEPTGKTAPIAGPVVLQVDRSLHDPAAWVEDETSGAAHSELKARIADQFAAEVGRAATNPDTAGKTLDETWRDARARSNWEYQKFFGGEAANRAAVNAGRAAVSKQ